MPEKNTIFDGPMREKYFKLQKEDMLLVAGFTLLYLLFPTHNSSSDAIGYAAFPETGPHHLLYDKLAILSLQWLAQSNPAWNLAILKIINAIAAGGILLIGALIFHRTAAGKTWPWILISGSCFGFMRFATENETYVIPFLLAMAATLSLLNYLQNRKTEVLFLSFFYLSVAVLFHQMYVFWLIAFALATFFTKSIPGKHFALGISAILFIPLVYFLVAMGVQNSAGFPWNFFVGELNSDTVQLKPGLSNFLLTPISFIRSFIQVHGNVWLLFQKFWMVKIVLAVAVIFILLSKYSVLSGIRTMKTATANFPVYTRSILIAFVLQLLFAWYSVGNAEFMLMLPMLFFLFVAQKWAIPQRPVVFMGLGFLLWNLGSAIIPARFLNYENFEANTKKMKERGGLYISQNATMLHNYYFFMNPNGIDKTENEPPLLSILKPPADKNEEAKLDSLIDNMLGSDIGVYTDWIDYPGTMSRSSMLEGKRGKAFFEKYQLAKTDSFSCFYGTVYIHRIISRKQVFASDRQGFRCAPFCLQQRDILYRQIFQ